MRFLERNSKIDRHCEGVKRPKQSPELMKKKRLPRPKTARNDSDFLFLRWLVLVTLFFQFSLAQYSWQPMPNAPTTTSKHDDVYFISSTIGFVVTRDGKIFKTADGGDSWNMKASYAGIRLRCIGFADSLRGWAGKFQIKTGDPYALLETIDGGETWNDVKNIQAPAPQGMCALFTDLDPIIYGCGRYAGPPIFIKSTDGGASWISKDLSSISNMLIDIYFFNPDTGIIAGAYGNNAAILLTTNGGDSWERIFTSTHADEWCWKISFPDRMNGFVSLQTFGDSVFFLRTTDGGLTWKEHFFLKAAGQYSPQGIGFITKDVGWIGAYPSFGTTRSEATYKTTDGGTTWAIDPTSKNINRIRWLNDTLGFAAGNTVYTYAKTVTGVRLDEHPPVSFILNQNYPNPFNPSTTISFEISRQSFVTLRLFDLLGRQVAVLLQDDELQKGRYNIPFEATDLSSGIYLYRLEVGTHSEMKKMTLTK